MELTHPSWPLGSLRPRSLALGQLQAAAFPGLVGSEVLSDCAPQSQLTPGQMFTPCVAPGIAFVFLLGGWNSELCSIAKPKACQSKCAVDLGLTSGTQEGPSSSPPPQEWTWSTE